MIVKNEAHVIRRCLESALPLLDYALIVDTGSTDHTRQAIREFLNDRRLAGEVLEENWRDFAYNRSFALQKLRERQDIDYALMIDADEILVFTEDFDSGLFKQNLNCDIYDIETCYAGISYLRPQLFRNKLPFCFKGVLHEYLDIQQTCSRETVTAFYNHPLQDSARSHNPTKFLDDAQVLENAIAAETDPFLISRYAFYLAQSYRDGGKPEQALKAYSHRSELGYWNEEVFISLLNAGRLKEQLAYPEAEVIQTYLAAYEVMPARLESLHDAIRFCRLRNKFQQAYLLANHALNVQTPSQGLFLEPWIYDYGLLDEFSIVAYWAGHYQESLQACLKLLNQTATPPSQRPRIRANAAYAIDKIGKPELNQLLPPG
jgi:glycosyltransferase involved in cell wall biosynthesis